MFAAPAVIGAERAHTSDTSRHKLRAADPVLSVETFFRVYVVVNPPPPLGEAEEPPAAATRGFAIVAHAADPAVPPTVKGVNAKVPAAAAETGVARAEEFPEEPSVRVSPSAATGWFVISDVVRAFSRRERLNRIKSPPPTDFGCCGSEDSSCCCC